MLRVNESLFWGGDLAGGRFGSVLSKTDTLVLDILKRKGYSLEINTFKTTIRAEVLETNTRVKVFPKSVRGTDGDLSKMTHSMSG